MPVATMGDIATHKTTIDTKDIEAFAKAAGDRNPIHLDEEYAENTMFSGRIVHGILTAGVISAALADLPGDIIYLSQRFDFEAPVRPGDTVVAEVEVNEILEGDRVRVRTEATLADPNDSVLEGEAVVLSLPHGKPPNEGNLTASE